ncbi:hypothetical protein [uncultured Sphingomonas sp.]|uniref:hypothetical protein n=1 Tax=uncultured Sphingomonas sp. TaxID=158754 RepID=UPI0025DA9C56|nr:hypothetical protein [uncultured Sphingomonas sp.]
MRRGIWATLDCDPTGDRSAIRRAYAARLKAMDVDADPDAFEALRDARDAALARAADPAAAVDPLLADVPLPPVVEPEPAPESDPLAEAMNAHFHALEALLFPGHDVAPTADELTGIDHHGRALLADPRLEQVDFATGAERWFAETLAASVPRSDPLLEPAAATFGWIERREDYALSAEAHAIVERIGATRFVALVGDPKHRWHKAWVELTRDDDRRRNWLTSPTDIRDMLTTVRTRYPDAERRMNPERVAYWDKWSGKSPRIRMRVWLAVALFFVAVRIGMSWWPDTPPKPDANYIAQTLTGKNLAEVQKINPGLASDIVFEVANATPKGRSGKVATNDPIIGKLTVKRLQAGMATPPDDLLVRLTRFDLGAMRAVQQRAPASCLTATVAIDPQLLPEPMRVQQRALLHEVMLNTNSYAPINGRDRFTIPGAMLDAVATRTGWPMAKVRQVLRDDKDPPARCTLEIALREAGLAAQNGMGMKLLRDLQPLVAVPDEPRTLSDTISE